MIGYATSAGNVLDNLDNKQTMKFEPKLVKLLKEFFTDTQQHAGVIRLKQPQPFGSYQECDILVLSSSAQYRLAIECKSVLLHPDDKTLYFSSNFTTDAKGAHQVSRMTDFCGITGLMGVLAVELRAGGKGHAFQTHLVPWRVVNRLFVMGEKGIPYETIKEWPQFKRVGGVMNLDECLDGIRYSLDED
jgi:hypothetical protein